MGKKQLAALFVCNLAPYIVGNALLLLLPLYLKRLGADSTITGLYLAAAFLSLAVSTTAAGWLADRFQRRKAMLVAAGVLAVPLALLMAVVTSVALLTVITAALWFIGGIIVAMVNILAGLFAGVEERGRVFGTIGVSLPLGGFIGGLTAGFVVDRWGFPALFALCALTYAGVPLAGVLLKDKFIEPVRRSTTASSSAPTNWAFLFLFCASVLAYVAHSEITLIRPLIMDGLDFEATAISATGGLGSLTGLPLPFIIGWLSDRFGRKIPLMLCYLAVASGVIILMSASAFWQFWITSVCQSTLSTSMVLGSALVTDVSSRESLGTWLSRFGATPWVGFVIGFSGAGTALQAFDISQTLMIGVLLAVTAAALVLPIRPVKYQVKVA